MEERKTLTVTLETVTPLFLGGAEPRERPPELRPPAVRGALRYWLRAALGGVIGDKNLAGLHKLESAVFGSTEYGSPIHVRLRGLLQSGDEKILPHKEGKLIGQRKAFGAGQTIELLISQLRSNDEIVWQAACLALNLTLTFGGVGLRSRRGYGTLRVIQSSKPVFVPPAPTTLEGWRQHVEQVVEKAVATIRDLAQSREIPLANLPPGPARYPSATRLGVVRICEMKVASATAAVTQFMKGVPKDQALGGIKPRQASPLWVRPIQLGEQYGLLLAVLASDFGGKNYDFVRGFVENFPGQNLTVEGWNA